MEKSPDAFRTISEVAEWLDTPAHVLRFWESRFPQIKPVKRAGGRRYYRPADMALLGGIKKLLHDDGMTIRGVQKLLREQGIKHVAALSGAVPAEAEPATGEVIEGTADEAPMMVDAPDEADAADNVVTLNGGAPTQPDDAGQTPQRDLSRPPRAGWSPATDAPEGPAEAARRPSRPKRPDRMPGPRSRRRRQRPPSSRPRSEAPESERRSEAPEPPEPGLRRAQRPNRRRWRPMPRPMPRRSRPPKPRSTARRCRSTRSRPRRSGRCNRVPPMTRPTADSAQALGTADEPAALPEPPLANQLRELRHRAPVAQGEALAALRERLAELRAAMAARAGRGVR